MTSTDTLLRVAVPVPLAEAFDYLWENGPPPLPGCRVRVPFGRSQRIGIVLEHPQSSPVLPARLKPVLAAIDAEPVLTDELLQSLRWAAEYYHHPIGEVLQHALPAWLRQGRSGDSRMFERCWRLTAGGRGMADRTASMRAVRQAQALNALACAEAVTEAALNALDIKRPTLKRLASRGWAECFDRARLATNDGSAAGPAVPAPELTAAQRVVLTEIESAPAGFAPYLLHGVTGSGKTEVYMRLMQQALAHGQQTLMLVPEIGLTPQLVSRLEQRFPGQLAVMHSGLTETRRLEAWRRVRGGQAGIVVGTRSAVFAPLIAAGVIIVDEEHDPSYKQQQGFRYSARDLAVLRGNRLDIPVVLASATPALETWHHARTGRYTLLRMPERIGGAQTPQLRVIDMNRHAARRGLSTPLVSAIERHLGQGRQVMLFLNRRGFAPVLFCPECQRGVDCLQCDAYMTVHARAGRLRCHHCGAEQPLQWSCTTCGGERIAVGAGTQRIADELKVLFPDVNIARLDRDSTAPRGALLELLREVEDGRTGILVGTQMLTKGHDFPRVTLVGVLNADQGLFGTDFRSDERLAQTILQVAGRAGRGSWPGEVLIQTHHPEHPLLARLMTQNYDAFAELALADRRAADWPPFAHLAAWRAEAARRSSVYDFLQRIRDAAASVPGTGSVRVLGPAPDRLERTSGRYRGQLLMQCPQRRPLHALLSVTLASVRQWPESRQLRWAVDVDPVEL